MAKYETQIIAIVTDVSGLSAVVQAAECVEDEA